MDATTAAVAERPPSRMRRLRTLCIDSAVFVLHQPVKASWWAVVYMPFTCHLFLIYWALFALSDGHTISFYGNTSAQLERVVLLLTPMAVFAEIARIAWMRVDHRMRFLLFFTFIPSAGYPFIALWNAGGPSNAFNTDLFYMVATIVTVGLAPTILAGMAILQRSSDITDGR